VALVAAGRSCSFLPVELDPPSNPAGYVSLLLINEAAFPGERGFESEEDSKAGKEWWGLPESSGARDWIQPLRRRGN